LYKNIKLMAKDKIHNIVKEALTNEGWNITHDPYYLKVLEVEQEIDLGAEEIVAAEFEGKKIAIEIKSFLKGSFINEFHGALGQYLNYQIGLEEQEPDRILYLAVSSVIYTTYFQKKAVDRAIEKHQIKIIVIDIQTKKILQWIK
jgi:hypothetical protein